MKISIFGLGYVGCVSAGCLAALGHQVLGIDINPMKVNMINVGESPVIEGELAALIVDGVRTGSLRADTNSEEAVLTSDISLICVGTPGGDTGNIDVTAVERVCRQIGQALHRKDGYHAVVVRSTILPGTSEERLIPILESTSGRRTGVDLGFAFNPEFLREGTAVQDFYHPPFNLIGRFDERGAELAAGLYAQIQAPLLVTPLRVAEMVKYANNAFHALKIGFANEIGNLCKRQGIDSHQVMDILCADKKLNLSASYLKPGFAFGGSCLPKDLRALLYLARRLDLSLPVLEAILPSNELQIKQGFELIKQAGGKKVAVLGLSFKAGTDDLRESPLVVLIETLIGKGYQVRIYDRNVSLARLHGANQAYIEREIPHIATLMCSTIEEAVCDSDVVVIGNRTPEFGLMLDRLRQDQVIIDFVRMLEDAQALNAHYEGICW